MKEIKEFCKKSHRTLSVYLVGIIWHGQKLSCLSSENWRFWQYYGSSFLECAVLKWIIICYSPCINRYFSYIRKGWRNISDTWVRLGRGFEFFTFSVGRWVAGWVLKLKLMLTQPPTKLALELRLRVAI